MWLKPVTLTDRQEFEAARMQHAYSWAIRKQARERFGSVKNYAAAAGLRYDRLARVLRGQAVLRIDDIGVATVLLGDVHEIAHEAMKRRALFA